MLAIHRIECVDGDRLEGYSILGKTPSFCVIVFLIKAFAWCFFTHYMYTIANDTVMVQQY